jgi:serine/threonine protein kinase
MSHHADDPLIGQQLGDYRIETLLGKGGMARVYRGLDPNLNRVAANEAHPQQAAGYRSLNTQFRSKLRGIRPTLD